jgi:hypothetical protein
MEQIKRILEPIPMTLPDCDKTSDEYFRCRVWLKQAIRVLDREGIISCPDADAVVNKELRIFAEANYAAISGGTGGFRFYVSQHSK